MKKLGGGLFIDTTAGMGSRFTIRLPFTLAISQALIVRVGEEAYALPLLRDECNPVYCSLPSPRGDGKRR